MTHKKRDRMNVSGLRWTACLAAAVVLCLLPSASVTACSTPVFQWALLRWQPDPYEAVVFHRGDLAAEQQEVVAFLRARAADAEAPLNLQVQTADLDGELEGDLKSVFDTIGSPAGLPVIALRFPRLRVAGPVVWTAALTEANARLLAGSPMRRKIAERILAGDVAAWVLLESGNKEKDDAVAKRLTEELKKAKEGLEKQAAEQPEAMDPLGVPPGGPTGAPAEDPATPKTFNFSVLRLDPKDPAEQVLVSMLMKTELDLHEFAGQPIAFPVFGRGRALYALVGKGIAQDNIAEAAYFLSGPCACEVKAQNPGTDLLMAANWKTDEPAGPLMTEIPLPPLTRIEPRIEDPGTVDARPPEGAGEKPKATDPGAAVEVAKAGPPRRQAAPGGERDVVAADPAPRETRGSATRLAIVVTVVAVLGGATVLALGGLLLAKKEA